MTAFNSLKFCSINAKHKPNSGHTITPMVPKHFPPLSSHAAASHQKVPTCFTSANVREHKSEGWQSVLQVHRHPEDSGSLSLWPGFRQG